MLARCCSQSAAGNNRLSRQPRGGCCQHCSPLLALPAAPAAVTPQLMVASSRPSIVELSVVLLL